MNLSALYAYVGSGGVYNGDVTLPFVVGSLVVLAVAYLGLRAWLRRKNKR